jgi:hypothetical protein
MIADNREAGAVFTAAGIERLTTLRIAIEKDAPLAKSPKA